ncbi:MAG TPA: Stk1 family PASTA domain-containing Ser/Thr kinase [Thermoleophilia bacterium]|nr:Stk1 family PASTA domain-containing Ser/Thr kinase [Thermoleophilia bacterium]
MSDVFQPEQVIGGRYRVVRKLGGGGMADVYLCEDLTLGRHVAIKVLLQRYLNDATFVERFRREAKAAAGLNQQNLVAIYDWGEVDGTYYIAMEYVEGETLKDLIRRRGRLSGNESVAVAMQLLAAVEFAHRSGIVHRDIKPQNVMLDRGGTVKVMDFGIARAGDSGMTEAGSILGTAQYLAPEQAMGHPVDERSDLYSVGVVLYEMLTGTVPFKGDSAVTVALKHVNEVPREPSELVPGMPYALNQIVLKAMAKDPADRYQSAAEFARDLRAAREGGPVQAAAFDAGGERTRVMTGAAGMTAAEATSVLDQPLPPRRKKSRWPLILIVLLLAIIAAVAVALWWTMSGNKAEVPGVVGLSRAAAVRALEQDGFKAAVQQEFSERVAEGFVSRQAPTAGTKLREGATVDIWVSKGSQKAEPLPDFSGWTPSMVDDWLARNDLQGDPRTGRSNAVSEGQVFRQDPAPGTQLNRGDTVSYWVSRGKPQATVPDLTNLTQADAEAALAEAGLRLGSVTPETSETVPAGAVVRQDPPAGEKVDKDSVVNIVVSSGPPTPSPSPTVSPSGVAVPNVYGMQSSIAEQELVALGLAAAFREKPNTGQQPGTVVSVKPDAGTVVPAGSTVTLVIAS